MSDVKQNYHAVTLDKRDSGEMDRLYTFYTLENGLMRVPARSIRRSEAKLAAQVEDFVFSHITIAKNYGRGTLVGAVAEEYFNNLRGSYEALLCVDHARRVLLSVIGEHDRDQKIFALLVSYLQKMEQLSRKEQSMQIDEQMWWMTYAFLLQLFELQGYIFDAKTCTLCREYPDVFTRNLFDARCGGLVCMHCIKDKNDVCMIDTDTIKSLRIIHDNHIDVLSKVIVHKDVNRQLGNIIAHIERWIMR
jgi:DNA repair protein RecO (recombination protein O)